MLRSLSLPTWVSIRLFGLWLVFLSMSKWLSRVWGSDLSRFFHIISRDLFYWSPKQNYYDRTYTSCIVACPIEDVKCLAECSREHHDNLLQCPCQSGCPFGCPCPDYICPVPNTEVLILSTRKPKNRPIIINSSGRNDQDFYFEFEAKAEVLHSCSIFWQNQHYVFGGQHEKRQVLKIVNCQLTSVGKLDFDFNNGGCATTPQEQIYLCFDEKNSNTCWSGKTPTGKFNKIDDSLFPHKWTRIAAGQCNVWVLVFL